MFHREKKWQGILLACVMGVAVFSGARAESDNWLNLGPLFDEFDLTLAAGQRTEIAGPLFYSQKREDDTLWAIPPWFSHYENSALDAEEWDFFYPVMTYDRYGPEHRWQLFQIFNTAGGEAIGSDTNEIKKRFEIFPVYFHQHSTIPTNCYTGVIPFYGHLKNKLFRDESFWVMWPVYIQSRKRDVMTYNYFYPFFHLRYGNQLHGWQFWPLVGHEEKGVTMQTNGFGEVSVIGGHEKFFALWPFFYDQTLGIGTTNRVREQAFLPLYYWMRSPMRDQTTMGWPFFNVINDHAKKYREWQLPFPFIDIARGEGKTTTRVFPLFSRAHSQYLESDFYLWPVYKYNRVHSGALDRDRTRILLYLYSDVHEKNAETGQMLHRVDFFPFFTWRKDFNGNARLQVLSILDPILPNNKSVERDWDPVYAFWRQEKNPNTGASSQSLFWNLYRREVTPVTKKCSLLFGLFQYQSDGDGRRLRLFFIPVMKTHAAAAQPAP